MVKFVKKDDGLVTIEWVGIAAVMVLAAIAITAFVMQGANTASNSVGGSLSSISVPAPPDLGTYGNSTPPATP